MMKLFFNIQGSNHIFYKKLNHRFDLEYIRYIKTLAIVSFLLHSCNQKKDLDLLTLENSFDVSIEILDTSVIKSEIHYNNKTSEYSLNSQLFSGYMVSFYEDGTMKEKIGILNGKKQNKSAYWYSNGKLKQLTSYRNGKLHGEKILWSNELIHSKIAHLNYNLGKAHGEQKQWYRSGELYKILNLKMGKEEGIQKAFRKNGELYANYEAKNGRIFGLKKAALCYGLEDESINN